MRVCSSSIERYGSFAWVYLLTYVKSEHLVSAISNDHSTIRSWKLVKGTRVGVVGREGLPNLSEQR
jgi:hypothetical protein